MKNAIGYRVWQFGQSFKPALAQGDWDRIRLYLSPVEVVLFTKMPVPDQNHSYRVFQSLLDSGEGDEDLIKAALLHDIGKGQHPLSRWERVFAVLLGGIAPAAALAWGKGEPKGIKRPLVIVHQHPAWGAELARQAGGSELLVWLIRNHEQDPGAVTASPDHLALLEKLQTADNQN